MVCKSYIFSLWSFHPLAATTSPNLPPTNQQHPSIMAFNFQNYDRFFDTIPPVCANKTQVQNWLWTWYTGCATCPPNCPIKHHVPSFIIDGPPPLDLTGETVRSLTKNALTMQLLTAFAEMDKTGAPLLFWSVLLLLWRRMWR
jgi:hypothetical protein